MNHSFPLLYNILKQSSQSADFEVYWSTVIDKMGFKLFIGQKKHFEDWWAFFTISWHFINSTMNRLIVKITGRWEDHENNRLLWMLNHKQVVNVVQSHRVPLRMYINGCWLGRSVGCAVGLMAFDRYQTRYWLQVQSYNQEWPDRLSASYQQQLYHRGCSDVLI